MVDFLKPVMCGVNFKDYYKRPNSVFLNINVVLIDKTTNPLDPCLYELNEQNCMHSSPQLFIRLGEVVSLDTHKKLIILSNDNLVQYKHLIIASGPRSSWMEPIPGKEFAAGVQILMEALKMQAQVPSRQKHPSKETERKSKAIVTENIKEKNVPFPKAPPEPASPVRDNKRVYQVHL